MTDIFDSLKLGQSIFQLVKTTKKRSKILIEIDADGVEHYRYLPPKAFTIKEWQVIGAIKVEPIGFIPYDIECAVDVVVLCDVNDITDFWPVTAEDFKSYRWCITEAQALEQLNGPR